jgi:hypothetical protein
MNRDMRNDKTVWFVVMDAVINGLTCPNYPKVIIETKTRKEAELLLDDALRIHHSARLASYNSF